MTAENFLQITDSLSEPFFLVSASGLIVTANSAARELFAAGSLRDRQFSELFADDGEKVMSSLRLWSSSRQLLPASLRLRDGQAAFAVRCDGGVIEPAGAGKPALLLVRCIPRNEEGAGRRSGELGSGTATLPSHLVEQKARDDEKLATLGTAAAVFAHEIANPLNAVSTSLQLLQQELADANQNVKELTETASTEISRLSSLLNDFRSFAAPQFGDFKPADLHQTIRDVLAPEMAALHSQEIRVSVDFKPLPRLLLDLDKIKQAVCNLLKNAVEAMPHGGALTIKGSVGLTEKVVVLEITDTGDGIPDGVDVFQLFLTTKPGGSGLGLPIVAQIIAAHRGQIRHIPRSGKGTTFEILLPVPGTR